MTPKLQLSPRPFVTRGFTLVELLVVLAIIAVISAGVAVTYGRKNIDDAMDRMTLHEMGEIKKVFLRFENDNFRRLRQPISDHTGLVALPSSSFQAQFDTDHIDGSDPDEVAADLQHKAKMEFYEEYGLWFLMQQLIYGLPPAADDEDDDGFPVFDNYDGLSCEGWNGPYIDVSNRAFWDFGGISFPQIGDSYGSNLLDDEDNPTGVYRMLYYEHEHDEGDDKIIFRRLLLVSSRNGALFDELEELITEAGNLRDTGSVGRLNTDTGVFENRDDSPYFIVELMNFDLVFEDF